MRNASNDQMETAAKQLFQVIKDHNNGQIQEMLDISNVHCYRDAESSSDTDDDEFQPKHFPTVPCLFTLVNDDGYFDAIQSAIDRVRSDGLQFETLIQEVDPARSLGKTNEVTRTIQKIDVRCSAR